jgi:precorrin-3B methylase
MTTMVVIGNSKTYIYKNFMITPRGYNIWLHFFQELQKERKL